MTQSKRTNKWMLAGLLLLAASPLVLSVRSLGGAYFDDDIPLISFWAEIGMFVLFFALTEAGGGYRVLDGSGARKWGWPGSIVIAVLIVIVSVSDYHMVAFTVLGTAVAGVQRGVRMLLWAWRVRSGRETPADLFGAEPRRLAYAGAALIVLTLLLSAMALSALRSIEPHNAHMFD